MGSWRFSVGRRGVSRVTVFERPKGASIYVEWFDDDGRHRKALKSEIGHPVTDRELAMTIARRMSEAQERKRNLQAAEALGIPQPHTLKDLLDRRHADLEDTWTEKYRKDRARRKAFWLRHLGGDLQLTRAAGMAGTIERIVRREGADKSDRWRHDVLRYLVDSFIYAERKLKWIEPRHNLSAVDLPKPKGRSHAYTLVEACSLVASLWRVHPVAGWIGTVAFQTGRRLSAIRTLHPEHVTTEGRVTFITFPGETDKARNTGEAVVYDLPERTDWAVPSQEICNDWLHEAEKAAGIEHVKGRGYHGLKRLYATLTTGMEGADKQAGTLRSTLEGHYRQDVREPKMEVAKALAGHLLGQ